MRTAVPVSAKRIRAALAGAATLITPPGTHGRNGSAGSARHDGQMSRRPRWTLTVAAAALVLVACGTAEGGNPPDSATAALSQTSGAQAPASAAPASPNRAVPNRAYGPGRSGRTLRQRRSQRRRRDRRVDSRPVIIGCPARWTMPAVPPGQRVPAVLLLHGDLGDREADGMFVRLAAALADRGIASLRIDFAGSGESEEPDLSLDYPGMVLDATASLTYLEQDAALNPEPWPSSGSPEAAQSRRRWPAPCLVLPRWCPGAGRSPTATRTTRTATRCAGGRLGVSRSR